MQVQVFECGVQDGEASICHVPARNVCFVERLGLVNYVVVGEDGEVRVEMAELEKQLDAGDGDGGQQGYVRWLIRLPIRGARSSSDRSDYI